MDFSTNIKNLVVFFIYFFALYPVFQSFTVKKARVLFDVFFSVITVANTLGVLVSIGNFMLQRLPRIGLQGLIDPPRICRVSSIWDPSWSQLSLYYFLMVIIYLWMRLSLYNTVLKTLAISSIPAKFCLYCTVRFKNNLYLFGCRCFICFNDG